MTKSDPAVRFNFIHGVFDAPLHAMAISLDRVKRDLVLFTPSLEARVVDEFISIVAANHSWVVSPSSSEVIEVLPRLLSCFCARHIQHVVISIDDHEGIPLTQESCGCVPHVAPIHMPDLSNTWAFSNTSL